MTTLNSISGGKSSAYIAANYKADLNIFCLVRTDEQKLLWQRGKDEKTRQLVSDKLGVEFIGTLEQDAIIYTILDLEQYLGSEIIWLTGKTFDQIIKKGKEGVFLPSKEGFRFCTTEMKIAPIYKYLRQNKTGIVESRIGFRADEKIRVDSKNANLINGIEYFRKIPYSMPSYPLFESGIYSKDVESFWRNKGIRFAEKNNCVGCFHRSIPFLNLMAKKEPEKMEWFASKETGVKTRWKQGTTYRKIIDTQFTMEMQFDDFSSCDSGGCGL